MIATDPYHLQRFVDAQDSCFAQVRSELAAGKKRTHWMWFVFPQIQGLGSSGMAQRFAISGIEVAVFLRELRDHQVRLSLRSKGRVNVATIAEQFGGGGHESASGCTLDGPLPAATERILKYLRNEMAIAASVNGMA